MDISLDDIPETSVGNHVSYRRLSWDKLTADDRAKYFDVSHDLLSRIEIPDAVHCTDVNSCDASYINDTNLFYEQTMRSLIQASDTVFSNPPPPLTREPLNRGGLIMLLNCTMHIRMLLGCGAMLANREMEIYLNYGGYQRLDTNMLSGSSNVMRLTCVRNH